MGIYTTRVLDQSEVENADISMISGQPLNIKAVQVENGCFAYRKKYCSRRILGQILFLRNSRPTVSPLLLVRVYASGLRIKLSIDSVST